LSQKIVEYTDKVATSHPESSLQVVLPSSSRAYRFIRHQIKGIESSRQLIIQNIIELIIGKRSNIRLLFSNKFFNPTDFATFYDDLAKLFIEIKDTQPLASFDTNYLSDLSKRWDQFVAQYQTTEARIPISKAIWIGVKEDIEKILDYLSKLQELSVSHARVIEVATLWERKELLRRKTTSSQVSNILNKVASDTNCNYLAWQNLLPEDCEVIIDGDSITEAILNLVRNSMFELDKANRDNKNIRVEVSLRQIDGLEFIVMSVADNGLGIPVNKVYSVFQMGHSGKGSSGLGLSIVQRIAALHNGQVHYVSDESRIGALFEIRIPRLNQPSKSISGIQCKNFIDVLGLLLSDSTFHSQLRWLQDHFDTSRTCAYSVTSQGGELVMLQDPASIVCDENLNFPTSSAVVTPSILVRRTILESTNPYLVFESDGNGLSRVWVPIQDKTGGILVLLFEGHHAEKFSNPADLELFPITCRGVLSRLETRTGLRILNDPVRLAEWKSILALLLPEEFLEKSFDWVSAVSIKKSALFYAAKYPFPINTLRFGTDTATPVVVRNDTSSLNDHSYEKEKSVTVEIPIA